MTVGSIGSSTKPPWAVTMAGGASRTRVSGRTISTPTRTVTRRTIPALMRVPLWRRTASIMPGDGTASSSWPGSMKSTAMTLIVSPRALSSPAADPASCSISASFFGSTSEPGLSPSEASSGALFSTTAIDRRSMAKPELTVVVVFDEIS